jgi:hypothetical protein
MWTGIRATGRYIDYRIDNFTAAIPIFGSIFPRDDPDDDPGTLAGFVQQIRNEDMTRRQKRLEAKKEREQDMHSRYYRQV